MADARPAPVLAARNLARSYDARGGAWRRDRRPIRAVDGVSLVLGAGECQGLVGESGAGKSTLARLLAALEVPDEGEVLYLGRSVRAGSSREDRDLRRTVQIVFQDPAASLDPLQRIADAVAEPLVIHRLPPRGSREDRVRELLGAVGLPSSDDFLKRRPGELSGGERQRVVVARALACEPRALLLDEPVAALDASVRGQVLNLLAELRERLGLAMLLIAHDLTLVSALCERVAVMMAGRIVEEGPSESVLTSPLHPYTATLMEASSAPVARASVGEGTQDGGAWERGAGCPWAPKCERAGTRCKDRPELGEVQDGHAVACHFPRGR